MISIVIFALLAAAGAAWWFLGRAKRAAEPAPDKPQARPRFGSVEIRVRTGACEAAHALAGQRFLAHEAPALPLPSCAAARCTCSFVKLSDRRTEDRRLEHAGLSASLFRAKDRREQSGRRDEDAA